MDPASFRRCEGLFAEFKKRVLSGEALPAFRGNPGWIDSAGRAAVAARSKRSGSIGAVRIAAIVCARNSQGGRNWDRLHSVGHVRTDAGAAASCCAVGGSTRVVHHMDPGGLVTG